MNWYLSPSARVAWSKYSTFRELLLQSTDTRGVINVGMPKVPEDVTFLVVKEVASRKTVMTKTFDEAHVGEVIFSATK